MFSGIWRKVKKKNMKKERKFGLKEFPRPLFFENGGHSILAIKLEVELSERIEYTDVYRYPTVASLAAFIDEKERDDNNEL